MSKIIVDVVLAPKRPNAFLRAAGVFEPGKYLVNFKQLDITGTPEVNKLCERIKTALTEAGEEPLFVAIRHIDSVRAAGLPYYLMDGVQTVSIGNHWMLFKEALRIMGYSEVYNDRDN